MRRPIAVLLAGLVAAMLALVLPAAVATAKEFVEARLDAPIALGTPGGTTLLVGITVTVPDGGTSHPVEGTPMYVKLVGRYGDVSRSSAAADGPAGHYAARIEVPAGGARDIEIGIGGSSDLPVMLTADAFVAGGISARTSQVAPPLEPAATPLARTPASAEAIAAPAGAPAGASTDPAAAATLSAGQVVDPSPQATGPGPAPVAPAALAGLAVLLAIAGISAARRARRAGPRVDPRVPGA